MNRSPAFQPRHPDTFPRLPDWLRDARTEGIEEAGFSSGAALALLHQLQARADLPQALWRDRLALRAAAQSARCAGRPEGEAAIRDVLCLLRPDERPGPAGEIGLAWQRAAGRPPCAAGLSRALPLDQAQLALWQRPGQGHPVAQAAEVIGAMLDHAPRDHLAASILGDAALARAVNWPHLIPLLGLGLTRRDLAARGEALRLACHRALLASAARALQMAADLTRRAAGLRAARPRLRARQSDRACELFLTRDAVAPAMLTGFMSDRAARRFCDRLVELGAARELTGRDAFRLYGV